MKYPIYIIKEYQDNTETIYKYTNFMGCNIGQVRINLDTNQIIEEMPLSTEQHNGIIFQKVSSELLSNIQKHIMFL